MINKVILLGNVGKDPEVKQLDGGNTIAKFSLATSESYKNKAGEKVTNTEWHNIIIWGTLAGVVEKYVTKGQTLYLEGKVVTRSYDDKDGNKRYATEIVCHTMQMIGRKESDELKPAADSITGKDNPFLKPEETDTPLFP